MLRVLVVAAMLAVAVPSLAIAQEHDDHHGGPPHPGGPPPHPGPPARPAFVPHGPPPVPWRILARRLERWRIPVRCPARWRPSWPDARRDGRPASRRVPGAQFSYRGHMIERVHRDPFIYPQGFGYRRWEVGAALPPIFLTPDYYYPEWAALGLEPPPPGCQWVRYGPDLILVDMSSGQVIDTAYDVFD